MATALQATDEATKWKIGATCEVYSRGQKRWIEAQVVDIFNDDEGRWIKVKYERTVKELSPDHSDLRPSASDKSSSNDSKSMRNDKKAISDSSSVYNMRSYPLCHKQHAQS